MRRINFIVTESFLRTKGKTDPFYDSIIKVIDGRLDYDWKIFISDKGVACGYLPSKVDYFRIFDVFSIWFYRLCRLFAWRTPEWKIYRLFGWLARPIFAKKFAADIIFTQAGKFEDEFKMMLPMARVIDLQHGVIHSTHRGYFDEDSRLRLKFRDMKMREFWLFGQGFADCFFKHPDNAKDLHGRVKVIGDVMRHPHVKRNIKNLIVVSGQFKPECSSRCLLEQVDRLREFLKEVDGMFADGCKVLIKHHPRFNGIEALDSLYKEFAFFAETKDTWDHLYCEMKVHVTFSSTVVFDAASNGIISNLISPPNDDPVLENWFWRDDYHYPYFGKNFKEVISLCDAEGTAAAIKDWYAKYYEPFTEQKCLKLLTEQRRSL